MSPKTGNKVKSIVCVHPSCCHVLFMMIKNLGGKTVGLSSVVMVNNRCMLCKYFLTAPFFQLCISA